MTTDVTLITVSMFLPQELFWMNNATIIGFSLPYDRKNNGDLGGCYAPSARHLHNSSDHTQLNHTDKTHMLLINFQR